MIYKTSRKAFTMIELVFVIVVIGILAGVAIPRLAATRDDAEITKGMTTLNSVRNALSIERQKRILRGDFTLITAVGDATNVFNTFSPDGNGNQERVLEYPLPSESKKYHWRYVDSNNTYFCLSNSCNGNSDTVRFQLNNGRFLCREADGNSGKCSILGVTAE